MPKVTANFYIDKKNTSINKIICIGGSVISPIANL